MRLWWQLLRWMETHRTTDHFVTVSILTSSSLKETGVSPTTEWTENENLPLWWQRKKKKLNRNSGHNARVENYSSYEAFDRRTLSVKHDGTLRAKIFFQLFFLFCSNRLYHLFSTHWQSGIKMLPKTMGIMMWKTQTAKKLRVDVNTVCHCHSHYNYSAILQNRVVGLFVIRNEFCVVVSKV